MQSCNDGSVIQESVNILFNSMPTGISDNTNCECVRLQH